MDRYVRLYDELREETERQEQMFFLQQADTCACKRKVEDKLCFMKANESVSTVLYNKKRGCINSMIHPH